MKRSRTARIPKRKRAKSSRTATCHKTAALAPAVSALPVADAHYRLPQISCALLECASP